MARKISVLLLLVFAVAGFAQSSITGDTNNLGRLEFVYPDTKNVVLVDGIVVEAQDGLKSVMELSHGKHLFQIYAIKGLLKKELVSEEKLNIPGGYIVRATLKDGKISVIDTVPIPGLVITEPETSPDKAEAALVNSKTSTTVVTTNESTSLAMGMTAGVASDQTKVTLQMQGMNSMNSGVTATEQTTITSTENTSLVEPIFTYSQPMRLSRIAVMSEEGNCKIYLDGQKKLELGFGDNDQMAYGKIIDVMPGTYLLKIEGSDVWYEGKLDVGSGEVVKIRTEPGKMDVVSRINQP